MDIAGRHEMDREYEAMDINCSDVKTEGKNWDTKRHQIPRQTGNDSARIRNFRAATVCLGLLCVLLLTAVIALCVYFNTNNAIFMEDLAKQRDQLNQEKTELRNSFHEMDGWIYYKSQFYLISSEKKSWTDSRKYCTEREASLIIINNREEQDFVKTISGGEKVWIGLNDIDTEGSWKWVDGSTLTSVFWATGEPNGHRKENCVMSYSSGWADVQCSYELRWICEKSISKSIIM